MNWLDLAIVAGVVVALLRGVQVGVVRQALSTIGFFVGVFLGALLNGQILHDIQNPNARAMVAITVILGVGSIFSVIGEYAGAWVYSKMLSVKVLHKIDRYLGAPLAACTLLVTVWFAASMFGNTPLAALQRQIRGSAIIAKLNTTLPPAPSVVARLSNLIAPNSFPQVFEGLEPKPQASAPLPDLSDVQPAVAKTITSVVRIEGKGCGGIVEGSGFVAADATVVTNAHVVAGVTKPYVIDSQGDHTATVTWFDPDLDLAILRTNGLAGAPLVLQSQTVGSGTPATVIGYPGGNFKISAAAVLDTFNATGRNIYNQGSSERQVYSLRGDVHPGNSGGPLIAKDGSVIGVIFAESASYDHVAYALTMPQVISALNQSKANTQTVSTGGCAQ